MHDIEIYNRRLGRLAVQMGIPLDEDTEVVQEIDTSGMSTYEKGRCECTVLMSRVREDTKCLDALDQHKATERATVSNRIRRNLRDLKTRADVLKKESVKSGRQDDFLDFSRHMKKTENMYKQRFRSDQSREDASLGEDGVSGYGTTNLKTFEEIKEEGAYGGGGYGGGSENLLDPMQDEEFQMYYQMSVKRDQEIDQGLVRVYQSLQRVKQNAQEFSTELETQNRYLDRINEKAAHMVNEMGGLNTRLKKTLKEVDKEKFCCYMICLILILGVLGVVVSQTGLLKS